MGRCESRGHCAGPFPDSIVQPVSTRRDAENQQQISVDGQSIPSRRESLSSRLSPASHDSSLGPRLQEPRDCPGMTADHRLAGGDELIHLLARKREAGADRQKPRAQASPATILLLANRAPISTVITDSYSPTSLSLLRASGSSSLGCCSGIGRLLRGSGAQRSHRRTDSSPTGPHGAGDGRVFESPCPCPCLTSPSLLQASDSSGLGPK